MKTLFMVMLLTLGAREASAGPLRHVLLIGYGAAAAVDVTQLAQGMERGTVHEANPFLAPLAKSSPVPAMAVKGAMHAAIADLLLHKKGKKWTVLAAGLLGAQVAVDVMNARTLRGSRRCPR